MDPTKLRTVAIVQARLGSSRLPGKVMRRLAGRPVLWHVVQRLDHCRTLDQVVIATTTCAEDEIIAEWGACNHIPVFRGSSQDVLDRYYAAARHYDANVIVRITADCPVIDPQIVDEVVEHFRSGDYHICGLSGEFPDGLDCEVFSFPALEAAWRLARLASDREHVTPFLYRHPAQFRVGRVEKFHGLAHHRWTLDEEHDFQFLSAIYDRLYVDGGLFVTSDILDVLEREPELMQLNEGILRNEGYARSLAHDYEVTTRS